MKKFFIDLALDLNTKSPLKITELAREKTVFYKNLYNWKTFNKFEDVPFFTKYDIPDDITDMVRKDREADIAYIWSTSWSSWKSTPAFFTKKEIWNMVRLLKMVCPYVEDIKNENIAYIKQFNKRPKAVNGLTYGFTIAAFWFDELLQQLNLSVFRAGSRSTIAVPQRTAEVIKDIKPRVIVWTPHDITAWLSILKEKYPKELELVLKEVKYFLTTAEPCSISRQKQLEKTFWITHLNIYASVDWFASIPCKCWKKHLTKTHYVELFDKDRNLIGTKWTWRLVFTTLFDRSTPMVRYMLDDYITVKDCQCEYGFDTEVIPHWRYELTIDIWDKIYWPLDFEEVIYKYWMFMNYEVKINSENIEIVLEKYCIWDENYDLDWLKNEFEEKFKLKTEIKLLDFNTMSEVYKVREAKSILKVQDLRTKKDHWIKYL